MAHTHHTKKLFLLEDYDLPAQVDGVEVQVCGVEDEHLLLQVLTENC